MKDDSAGTFLPVHIDELVSALASLAPENCRHLWVDLVDNLRVVVAVHYDTIVQRIRGALLKTLEDTQKVQLLKDLQQLFAAAQYTPLSKETFTMAQAHQYEFNFPFSIQWEKLDTGFLDVFYTTALHGRYFGGGPIPRFAKRLLVHTRGTGLVKKEDYFILDKINLILEVLWAKLHVKVIRRAKETAKGSAPPPTTRVSLEDVCRKEGLLNIFHKKVSVEEPVFQSVIIAYQLVPDKDHPDPPKVELQMYKDIPYGDLDAIFPCKEVRLRPFDNLYFLSMVAMGVGMVLATVYSMWSQETKDSGLVMLQVFAVVLVRQVMAVFYAHQTLQIDYERMMSEWGQKHREAVSGPVVSQLADDVKEQELKEMLLAYFFLWQNPTQMWTGPALMRMIDAFLREKCKVKVLFEVDDALRKLVALGLATGDPSGGYRVMLTPQQWLQQYPTKHLTNLSM